MVQEKCNPQFCDSGRKHFTSVGWNHNAQYLSLHTSVTEKMTLLVHRLWRVNSAVSTVLLLSCLGPHSSPFNAARVRWGLPLSTDFCISYHIDDVLQRLPPDQPWSQAGRFGRSMICNLHYDWLLEGRLLCPISHHLQRFNLLGLEHQSIYM